MPAVYDPEQLRKKETKGEEKPPPSDEGFRYIPDRSPKPSSDKEKSSPEQLSQAEKSVPQEHQLGAGNAGGGSLAGRLSGLKSKGSKRVAFAAILVAMLTAIFILIINTFYASLKLVNLEHHISDRRIARSAAKELTNDTNIVEEKVMVGTATDTETAKLLSSSRLGKALDIFRPDRVVENMQTSGVMSFETDAKGRVTKVRIGNQEISGPDLKFGRPINNFQERQRYYNQIRGATNDLLAKELKLNVNDAMLRDSSANLVRTRVSKAVAGFFGAKWYHYINNGKDEKGKSTEQAAKDEAKTINDEVMTQESGSSTVSEDAKKNADDANKKVKDCLVPSSSCATDVNNGQPVLESSGAADVATKYAERVKSAANGLGAAANFQAVLIPLCLAYDSSVKVSRGIIQAEQSGALKAYFALASAADQQKKGDVTAEAVGGFNSVLGDITQSIPEKAARGEVVNTTREPFAQASRARTYTPAPPLPDFFFKTFCPIMLDSSVFYAFLAAQIAATFGGAVVKEAAADAAGQIAISSLKEATGIVINNIAQSLLRPVETGVVNQALKFAAVQGAFTGGTIAATDALTYLGKMMVLSQMGALVDGADRPDIPNQADMGGVVYNDELSRQQNVGRPMVASETNATDKAASITYTSAKNSNKSVFQHYFALSNPDSFLSNEIFNLAAYMHHPGQIVQSFIRLPATFLGTMGHTLSPIFGHVLAAGNTTTDLAHYNQVEWGWTQDEQNKINNDSSFDPLQNAQILENAGTTLANCNGQLVNVPIYRAILCKYGVCWGYKDDGIGNAVFDEDNGSMSKLLSGNGDEGNIKIVRDQKTGEVVPGKGLCSPQNLSANNPEFGVLMLRWRVNQSYLNSIQNFVDTQNALSGTLQEVGGVK